MIRFSLKTIVIMISILLVAGIVVGYYVYSSSKETKTSTANQSFAVGGDEAFIDINGDIADLTQYANTIRVVNSWATWSPLSKEELPILNEVAKNYQDQGVVFLAINRKENKDYAKGYLATLPELTHLKIVFDPADNYFSTVEGYAMPETIIFDKAGNISAHYRGLVKPEQVRTALDAVLTENN